MFNKDTPNFNGELIRWLIAYKISAGIRKNLRTIYKEVTDFIKIEPLGLINILNKMIENECVMENRQPIYEAKSKNIHEITGYDSYYSLTKKGKKQLLFGWEFAAPAVPKESYEEILKSLCSTSKSED